MKRILFIALLGTSALTSQSPRPVVREEQTILVGRAIETWRLEWKTPPKPACGPDDDSVTCPCTGFAYGEGGDLDLVRLDNGREIDRRSLAALVDNNFGGGPQAILQRWEPDSSRDFGLAESGELERQVRVRPVVRIMQFADFDHDGEATEFFLQIGTAPCGKRMGIVVGLLRGHRGLSFLSTVHNPNEPLVMEKGAWQALRDATKPIRVTTWTCGDHGAETETELELSVGDRGVEALSREFECKDDGSRGRLLKEEPQ